MKPVAITPNRHFVGRQDEINKLREMSDLGEAAIIVVYGRRRVGKTELLEQVFYKRNLLKFEGIEGADEKSQKRLVLEQLARYVQDPLIAKIQAENWRDVFELIGRFVAKGCWTLYFEEVQWLAAYQNTFVSELKYVWDNLYRHNPDLLVILCGSSPSFMTSAILKSKALYNRSQYEIPLKEFHLMDIASFLGPKRSPAEIMDAALTVGGIPEYLKWINRESSVYLGICRQAFTSGGFFVHEQERIFVSSLGNSKNYRTIVDHLSKVRFATREEILRTLKMESGGTTSRLFDDLEICGFINKYAPFYAEEGSLLSRYHIQDAYLQLYYKFIQPIRKGIDQGDYDKNPQRALKTDTYRKWLGFAFERWCRQNHRLFARILGFEAVVYRQGAFFNRASAKEDNGYQIDLVYDRDDRVYTVCEIKYLQSPVKKDIIKEFERKLELFPNPKKRTLHKVLITSEGADPSVTQAGYFDKIISLKDIFNPRYWSVI